MMGIQLKHIYCIRLDDGADIHKDIVVTTLRNHAIKKFEDYVAEQARHLERFLRQYGRNENWWKWQDDQQEYVEKNGLSWSYFMTTATLLRWDYEKSEWIDITEEVTDAKTKRAERHPESAGAEESEGADVADQRGGAVPPRSARDGPEDDPRQDDEGAGPR